MIRKNDEEKNNSLKKGSGEALAFLCALPLIFILLVAVISIIKLTNLRQKMEYTAYVACRAAVVSDTYKDAVANAETVADIELAEFANLYNIDSKNISITIVPVKGYPEKVESGYDSRTGKQRSSSWKKGNFVKCVLTVHLSGGNPFMKGTKKTELTMAIEKEDY